MLLAATGAFDVSRMLLDLLIVLVAAKAAAELAERLRTPAVLGEIIAGILIGPHALGLLDTGHLETSSMLTILGELGVLMLLLQVGMEMDLAELAKVGRASMTVAVAGVVLPFFGGLGVGLAGGFDGQTSVFFGAALTATSVGITARVFGDLRALATTEARIVLGAAVADDVLGLIVLTVVVKVVAGGSVGITTVLGTFGLALGFLVVTGVLGATVVPRLIDAVDRVARSSATLAVAAVALTLAFASLAHLAKLAPIIGAFMAGLALGNSRNHERIHRDLAPIGNFLIPVFFLQIGINVDIQAMLKPSVLALGGALVVVAIIGKLLSAVGMLGTRADRLLVGIGMIPRGEVGLIFASIGLTQGVLDDDSYAALLIVVLVTTVMTPPLLRWRVGSAASNRGVAIEYGERPTEGWLRVTDGHVELTGTPPPSEFVTLALDAATFGGKARPSEDLLDWFGDARLSAGAGIEWQPAHTTKLLDLLAAGNPRSWRLLEVTGALEHALPEIAESVARRRADASELDPSKALRFALVEQLGQGKLPSENVSVDHRDLMFAALALDVVGLKADGDDIANLITRLDGPITGERIAAAISDGLLLRANSGTTDHFDQHEVLHLATHFRSFDRLHLAMAVAQMIDPLPTWQRESLQELRDLVLEALAHPELVGTEGDSLADARRDAARRLSTNPEAIERLALAPNAYVLAHDPAELVRQVRMVEPLPRKGVVRVAVTPDPEPHHWRIDVACRDQHGLLAHLSQVLHDEGLDVLDASIATWGDGAVLDSFLVLARQRPAARTLAHAMERSLKRPVVIDPKPQVDIEFDNSTLPWHTACTVTGVDQPGVLQGVTAAFASVDVLVHSARIATIDGQINDRFSVTDRLGRKIDDEIQARVRRALAGARDRRLSRLGRR